MNKQVFITPKVSKAKRVFDVLVSVLGLAFSAPLFVVIAAAIKLTSKGPVFYRQQRIGAISNAGANYFEMIKFRTMRVDAEAGTGAVWASANDNRLTPVGRFLRKVRLDELPQFINVLRGEMSLIGPRPERPEIAKTLEESIPFYLERTYGVVPGITGLAQVNQGYDTSLDDVRSKIAYDFAYAMSLTSVSRWLYMDIKIMMKTVMIMVLGRGQ
ncbi:sugar transferase [Thalassotalea euphylliae]|uniref:Sugar transferase n=1 Tax=Thalassotalea euphylliae TaxID=1655234 RepID=A0A3E0TVT7_9GAMM|nr:sugar transferase [Thalassotalea euphylliae]REL28022.1 sugar transferase [Thalassotalea euphylliae]